MRHFTCDLVSLIEEDPLDTNIVNIFAQYRTITSKEPLSHRVRIERVSPVLSRPYTFLCSSYTTSCQATIVPLLKWNTLRTVARARTALYDRTFHLGSTVDAATKNVRSR